MSLLFLNSNSCLNIEFDSEINGKKIALLVSVEDTNLTDDYDNSATQDADLYRDNIEESLEDRDFDDINKMSNPLGNKFLKVFKEKIRSLEKDDLLVFYFYGHGGQTEDISGDEKDDGMDETLVLKDREVLDDEIYDILNSVNSNAKVVIIIEACNSGSTIKIQKQLNNTIKEELHESLKEERKKPNLDILYIGATTDGSLVPSDAFNEVLLETFEEDDITNYYEFSKSLFQLMDEYHNIIPTIDLTWASKSFLESEPF